MLRPSRCWVAVMAIDLRCGIDRLLLMVQSQFEQEAFDGAAFVFRNRAGNRIKVLAGDAHGVWLCVRRLHSGRFVWPGQGADLCLLTPDQFAWLCMGVDWQRLSLQPPTATAI